MLENFGKRSADICQVMQAVGARCLVPIGEYLISVTLTCTTTSLSSTIFHSWRQKSRFFSKGGKLGSFV